MIHPSQPTEVVSPVSRDLLQPKQKAFCCADAETMHFPAWGGRNDGLQKDFLLESASLPSDIISMLTFMIVFPLSFYPRSLLADPCQTWLLSIL